jgi:hypothetical protein
MDSKCSTAPVNICVNSGSYRKLMYVLFTKHHLVKGKRHGFNKLV